MLEEKVSKPSETELLTARFLEKLNQSAGQNRSAAEELADSRNSHLKNLFSFLDGHSGSPQSDLNAVLRDTAFNLALGRRVLTANSGTYHRFGSEEPSQALKGLCEIVSKAGIDCKIELQVSFAVDPDKDSLKKALIALGAYPSADRHSKGRFEIADGDYRKNKASIIELVGEDKVNAWPALVTL